MLRRALIVLAIAALTAPGCSKKDDAGGSNGAVKADAATTSGGATKADAPEGGGGEAPPSPDEKRRGRRGIETDMSGAAKSLFADASPPPPFGPAATKGPGKKGPEPLAMPAEAKRTSRIALLAHHLKTMRKLRAGILSDKTALTVYDAGHKRVTFNRQALLSGDGRWVSAKVTTFVPKPNDAALEGAVGTITATALGWRIVYRYDGNRWRWVEVWRDRP